MSNYNRYMQSHLQEMQQEDEGATYRIEELECKLRLAESTANHILKRYEGLAQENNEGHHELESVQNRMVSMESELQNAFQYVELQNRDVANANERARSLYMPKTKHSVVPRINFKLECWHYKTNTSTCLRLRKSREKDN